ncbi:hypothetical protein V6N11_071337 [Hibiscus sabdariffa]|uniref:NAD-dependent epimerase/dehydratase domain-containing protein n=1 Tax=Hibiscus sabdariffa TaxID=183260 RepID=A0ABR2U0B9_9ROSI
MSNVVGKTVCVTGASGYVASWLVKQLLLRGYNVNASVRNPSAENRLKFFKADLLEEGSFDSVVEGCEGVFHTASPFFNDVVDPQAELIDPAVKGTLNVLNSCAKAASIKRVVLTSSIAAVAYERKPRTPDVVIDENWFTDPDYCKGLKKRWPRILPGNLQRKRALTCAAAILNLIKGAQTFPNESAFEIPSAAGRYCLVERVAHYSELGNILHKLYPCLHLPQKCQGDKPYMPTYQVSKEKAKTLGAEFIPLDMSLKETVESFKEKGFVDFPTSHY